MDMDATVKKLTKDFILKKTKNPLYLEQQADASVALSTLLLHAKKSIIIFSDLPNHIYCHKETEKSLEFMSAQNNIDIQLFSPSIPTFNTFLAIILQKGALIQPNVYQKYPELKKKPSFLIVDEEFALVQEKDKIKMLYNPKECKKLLFNLPIRPRSVQITTSDIKQDSLRGREYTD